MVEKWKLQGVQPDTCDPPGCYYIEMYDVLAPPPRIITVVAFNKVCPAHIATVSNTLMLWQDGNWKNKDAYIAYQKKWFRRLNHVEWLVDHPDEPMPDGVKNLTTDPITSGSVPAPSQAEIDGMNQAYNQSRKHNMWKNTAVRAIRDEGLTDDDKITWAWNGVGDARTLIVTAPALSTAQKNNARSKVDIQFGPGKVTIDK